jgi:hypothetical protein
MNIIICAATIMINLSGQPWTKFDMQTKKRAKVRCNKLYNDCLKKFVKKEGRHYIAICGGKKNNIGEL